MSWSARLLAVALVVTALPVSVGVLLSSPPPVKPLTTPLAGFDTLHVAVKRSAFCGRIPAADVAHLVGATAHGTSWSDGDTVSLGTTADVAHEYGCSWTGSGGRTISAWVFAPPVTATQAASYASAAATGCSRVPGVFGATSVGLRCGTSYSFRGLFGDAWLVCTMSGPQASADLAGRWCVTVVRAAS